MGANSVEAVGYDRGEGPCDPLYAPAEAAERMLLPADALLPQKQNLEGLWQRHTPDRFDVFSAVMILLQLAMPPLSRHGGGGGVAFA